MYFKIVSITKLLTLQSLFSIKDFSSVKSYYTEINELQELLDWKS